MFKSLFRGESAVQTRHKIKEMSALELHERILNGQPTTLIDVRTPVEYQVDGHIPGSRLLPLQMLAARLSELPSDATIVVICRSGHRSMVACEQLVAAGFEDVVNLKGGMISWHMSGLAAA